MNSIQDLRERRTAKAQEARKLLDENTGDKWGKPIAEKLDAIYAEIEDIDAQINRHQRLMELEVANQIERIKPGDIDPRSPKALLNKWIRGGDKALSAEDWMHIRNTMSTTTGSEGGFTVQTDVARNVAEALKAFGGMRRVAEVIQTSRGNDMQFPTSDGTSETGELIGQNTTATAQDPTFGSVTLAVYKYSSKTVAAPLELLQDSEVDMEAFIRNRLAQRIGRITNQHFTTGTGTGQPRGVVTAASLGKTGQTGQTTTVIFDDLVDLVHSVDPAYRESGRCVFMMNDATLKVIRKLKDSQGRPIFLPGWDGLAGPMPDTLLGYPVQINQDVAVMAANAKSILFGDFSYYKIRDVMELTLFRFDDSAYIKLGQIGFLAWMRSGGNFVDVGGAVKYYQNSAT